MLEGIARDHGKLPPWEEHASKGSWGKVSGDNPSMMYANVLMETMDEDGDKLLQEEEFVSYLAKTMMKEKAADEMRTANAVFEGELEIDEDVDQLDPDLKRSLMNEVFFILEMELPFIGV